VSRATRRLRRRRRRAAATMAKSLANLWPVRAASPNSALKPRSTLCLWAAPSFSFHIRTGMRKEPRAAVLISFFPCFVSLSFCVSTLRLHHTPVCVCPQNTFKQKFQTTLTPRRRVGRGAGRGGGGSRGGRGVGGRPRPAGALGAAQAAPVGRCGLQPETTHSARVILLHFRGAQQVQASLSGSAARPLECCLLSMLQHYFENRLAEKFILMFWT
jgi:hypothetical protein